MQSQPTLRKRQFLPGWTHTTPSPHSKGSLLPRSEASRFSMIHRPAVAKPRGGVCQEPAGDLDRATTFYGYLVPLQPLNDWMAWALETDQLGTVREAWACCMPSTCASLLCKSTPKSPPARSKHNWAQLQGFPDGCSLAFGWGP